MGRIAVIRLVLAIPVLVAGMYVGVRGKGPLPPMGPFLDPVHGVWAVARAAKLPRNFSGRIAALGDDVQVVYDRRGVPHIWASSTTDAMRALGYVVARDRLFQLELQTRATEGRLTEVAGPRALELDRRQRSLGLVWSAERNLAALDTGSQGFRTVAAYAQGVNAWIDQMKPEDIPLEYRFLNMRPERWQPIHSIELFKRMGYTLAFSWYEQWSKQVEARVGKEAAQALFPRNSPIQEPIQPNGRATPRFDFKPLPPPGFSKRHEVPHTVVSADGQSMVPQRDRSEQPLASNNWAVAPSRTANGFALLSGDPHLDLTLPSIWYEVHIVVPDELDVYGVTIPGMPGVVIGFNRDIAWSMTNTGADVLDFYDETLDDPETPARYLLDGEWRDLERRSETYLGRHGEVIAVDTMYFTHRGPVMKSGERALSMRWTVLDESGATPSWVDVDRSGSVDEFLNTMESFFAPAQNMIVADRTGNIAIRSTGHFPIRPDDGDGRKIRDGSRSSNDWKGYWPIGDYPYAKNPSQGFLASANQQPIDPTVSRKFLGVNWPSPWRAMRINRLLRADSQVTVDDMRRFQTDPGNEKANLFVPVFLEAARHVLSRNPDDGDLANAAKLLAEWDRKYTKENERAVLFELAMNELTRRVWDELRTSENGVRVATPTQSVLAALLHFPENVWWDDRSTDLVETRDHIMAQSLAAAVREARDRYGEPEAGGWRWDGIRHTNIHHMLGFRSLSALDLPVQGGPGNLNPSSGSGSHGASWRMVVELGPEVKAWAIYPGGQSGNPASRWYDNNIPRWVNGELEEVLFPKSPAELEGADVAAELTLSSGGK
ncbi:MAG: penicillin acylase family protein [Gemmatimonadales bacterium]